MWTESYTAPTSKFTFDCFRELYNQLLADYHGTVSDLESKAEGADFFAVAEEFGENFIDQNPAMTAGDKYSGKLGFTDGARVAIAAYKRSDLQPEIVERVLIGLGSSQESSFLGFYPVFLRMSDADEVYDERLKLLVEAHDATTMKHPETVEITDLIYTSFYNTMNHARASSLTKQGFGITAHLLDFATALEQSVSDDALIAEGFGLLTTKDTENSENQDPKPE